VVFLQLAVLVNHMPASDGEPPPSIYVAWPVYSNANFFVSQFARYTAVNFLPLLAPPALWLALNPTARALFLAFGGAPRHPPVRSSKA